MVVSLAHVRGRGTSRHYARGVTAARAWHLLTAVVALAALGLQLVLVVNGDAILVDHDPPNLAERLLRFLAYFTIESNILVLVTTAQLARDPADDGPRWRVVRIAAVSGITVTGLVHWFLLRPLLHLDGADLVADKFLHLSWCRSSRWWAGWCSDPDPASTGRPASGPRCGRSPGSS